MRIDIGRPASTMTVPIFRAEVVAIVAREASKPSDLPSTAEIIANIAQQIGGDA